MPTDAASQTPPVSPAERRVRAVIIASLALSALVIVGSMLAGPILTHRARSEAALPVLGRVPAFTLTDAHGAAVTDETLRGKVSVVDFFFTRCQGVCPLLTERMAEVARWAAHERPGELGFVSITVDPTHDGPAVLADYARAHGADQPSWRFLTGDAATIERASVEGFKLALSRSAAPTAATAKGGALDGTGDAVDGQAVLHGMKLVLVDRGGRIRGYYDATPEALPRLEDDARALVDEPEPRP